MKSAQLDVSIRYQAISKLRKYWRQRVPLVESEHIRQTIRSGMLALFSPARQAWSEEQRPTSLGFRPETCAF